MSKSKQTETAQWSPSRWDYDWGEGTKQARRARETSEDDAPEWWTDAYEIRMRYGIPEFDPDAFDYPVYPDALIHEKPARETDSAGGTDWLKVGERGCGKSTDNLNWACRLMDENEETVVWRGSPNRSEWLPFADWTTLWLPSPDNASSSAEWVYEESGRATEPVDDLEDLVREVRYYDDVLELVDAIGEHPPGTFNVVYPDPSFSGCEELTTETHRVSGTLPFVPQWQSIDEGGTPLTHWWYAFMLARVEFAESYGWTAWMFDEAADLVPPSVEQDDVQP